MGDLDIDKSTRSISFTPADTINQGLTRYVGFGARGWNATESNRQVTAMRRGTMKQLKIRVITNTLSGIATFRPRKNGANGQESLVIGAGLTGIFNLIANENFDVDDLVNWQLICAAGTGSIIFSITHEIMYY